MAVVMTVDGEEGSACDRWGTSVAVPAGYHLSCDSRQRFRAGGRVTFATLVRDNGTLSGDPGNIFNCSPTSQPPLIGIGPEDFADPGRMVRFVR